MREQEEEEVEVGGKQLSVSELAAQEEKIRRDYSAAHDTNVNVCAERLKQASDEVSRAQQHISSLARDDGLTFIPEAVAETGSGVGASLKVSYQRVVADLRAVPEGSIVMLHAVAHNPTGVDPTRAQWALILEACRRRRLLPWFDIAYQGFASGDPAEDAWAVRHFASQGMEMLVSQSFAKNMGLYCERVGALHVVAADAASAAAALSNVEAIVRPMYSNPPAHGARIVAKVLGNAELRAVSGQCAARGEGPGSLRLSHCPPQREALPFLTPH
jgi:hypothetical protein